MNVLFYNDVCVCVSLPFGVVKLIDSLHQFHLVRWGSEFSWCIREVDIYLNILDLFCCPYVFNYFDILESYIAEWWMISYWFHYDVCCFLLHFFCVFNRLNAIKHNRFIMSLLVLKFSLRFDSPWNIPWVKQIRFWITIYYITYIL